ncbi:MAG: alpha/beta hydrolase [Bifidobacteriaceae bacterium]|nr:alpha/beta hydrolase [Bifidobacteriaceae bacterium]
MAAAALVLTACSKSDDSPDPKPTSKPTPTPTAEPAAFWSQEVVWEECDAAKEAECATVEAPLNWDAEEGELIELALARVKATNPDERIGSLLINPGGPGGSGILHLPSTVSRLSDEVKARYDIVGFDPRGVGASSAVECYTTTEELDEYFGSYWPANAEGYESSRAVFEPWAEACAENTGPLLGHVDTVSSAKDVELLRHLLGDEQLNWLGYSYGTQLGATYAELFPDKVGRFVLDGAVDPSLSAQEASIQQAAGFEAAVGDFIDYCLDASACPFDGTKEEALAALHQFLLDVEEEPLPAMLGGGRELTLPLAFNGIAVAMYDEAFWFIEVMALQQAIETGDGSALMTLSDAYLSREGGKYTNNMMVAFMAINCLDARAPSDLPSVEAQAAALKAAAPTLGEFWGYGEMGCAVWPYPQTGDPHPVSAPGAGPILVIGTTGDPATPYRWAEALASQLESAVLLTYEGTGHTAYGRSNECVDQAVDAYLLEGTVPQAGLTC